MKDYLILWSHHIGDLMVEVDEYLNRGYVCVGRVALDTDCYYQAVAKP